MSAVVRMWEGAAEGPLDDVVRWLRDDVVPRALATTGCTAAEAFVSVEQAVAVLVTRWDGAVPASFEEGAGPALRRSAAWDFTPVVL